MKKIFKKRSSAIWATVVGIIMAGTLAGVAMAHHGPPHPPSLPIPAGCDITTNCAAWSAENDDPMCANAALQMQIKARKWVYCAEAAYDIAWLNTNYANCESLIWCYNANYAACCMPSPSPMTTAGLAEKYNLKHSPGCSCPKTK
jgi:hypothetical protein